MISQYIVKLAIYEELWNKITNFYKKPCLYKDSKVIRKGKLEMLMFVIFDDRVCHTFFY